MEGSRSPGLEVAMNFGFSLLFEADHFEEARAVSYASVVDDVRPNLPELRRALAAALEEQKRVFPVEIVWLDVREGSIVFELVVRLYDVGSAIAFFGGLMQGLEYLARIFQPVLEVFLRPFMPGPFHLQQAIILPQPPATPVMAAPLAPAGRDLLQNYLVASHAALLLLLTAVVIVLLARSG